MKKYNEYRTIIFTITTALVFALWGILSPIVSNNSNSSIFLLSLIGFIISLGFYRIVLRLVESVAIRFRLVKKLFLVVVIWMEFGLGLILDQMANQDILLNILSKILIVS